MPLDRDAIAKQFESLDGWELIDDSIRKRYRFADFAEAMRFVNQVADLAERVQHHPDIDIRWNIVILTLSTHSEGGLTTKDFNLATSIDQQQTIDAEGPVG